jgi:hypothetical protein
MSKNVLCTNKDFQNNRIFHARLHWTNMVITLYTIMQNAYYEIPSRYNTTTQPRITCHLE